MTEPTASPEDVQQQLEEKDGLIQALTDRLGEAAEQLDRIQRGGSNKSHSSGEMIELQRSLLEKLSITVEQWEDVQPRDAFARVESRLDDLRDLMDAAVGSKATPRDAVVCDSPQRDDPKQESSIKSSGEEAETAAEASGWEALKAQILVSTGGESDAPPPSHSPPASATPATPQPQPAQTPTLADVALPTPIEFQTADRQELEEAIEVRDGYIRYLTDRLCREQQRTRESIDWEALNNAPDELREALQSLEADLDERLRIAEVDLSLERARLSRVQSRTEEMQRQIERRLMTRKKSNSTDAAQKDRADDSDADRSSKGWLNTLGLK